MRIVIAGGHLTPALSVIEELPKDTDILYIGRKYAIEGDKAVSLEYQTITKNGIRFYVLKTGRIQRRLTRHSLSSFSKIPLGIGQSLYILKRFKPNVIVGFGGYVSFPVCIAGKILGIPIVIHEQTLEAGATNRVIGKIADKICISFESSKKYFPAEKVVFTGNPIRSAILHPTKKLNFDLKNPIIYITGGSLGSHAINQLVSSSLSKLLSRFSVIHQTGASEEFNDFDKLSILRDGLNNDKRGKYVISKFFSPEDIGSILKISDIVVSRAGINTVSELLVFKKPAFLIPLPISQKNEQFKNAMLLNKLGLAEVVEQKNLTSELFLEKINYMADNIEKYNLISDKNHIPKNATKKIVEVIYAVPKNSN